MAAITAADLLVWKSRGFEDRNAHFFILEMKQCKFIIRSELQYRETERPQVFCSDHLKCMLVLEQRMFALPRRAESAVDCCIQYIHSRTCYL